MPGCRRSPSRDLAQRSCRGPITNTVRSLRSEIAPRAARRLAVTDAYSCTSDVSRTPNPWLLVALTCCVEIHANDPAAGDPQPNGQRWRRPPRCRGLRAVAPRRGEVGRSPGHRAPAADIVQALGPFSGRLALGCGKAAIRMSQLAVRNERWLGRFHVIRALTRDNGPLLRLRLPRGCIAGVFAVLKPATSRSDRSSLSR